MIKTSKKELDPTSMISILPGELLEWIFSYLPTRSIVRASSVCKRWHKIITSDRFLLNLSHIVSQKPWYFVLRCSYEPSPYAYDLSLEKWYKIDLPCIERSDWSIVSSYGLVSFMDTNPGNGVYVYNPITRRQRKLLEPHGLGSFDHIALAIYVERPHRSHYYVSIVKTEQVPGNSQEWDVSVHLYDSRTMKWANPAREILTGWKAERDSVICNGTLYFLVHSNRDEPPETRHGLLSYNLSSSGPAASSRGILMSSFIPIPFRITCGRLMNLNDKLVMVAGMAYHHAFRRIKGISIWVLKGKNWEEVTRMPYSYIYKFGEFGNRFTSDGMEEMIYVQCYGSPAPLMFDMKQKRWEYVQNSPLSDWSRPNPFTGFCFEPRLGIAP